MHLLQLRFWNFGTPIIFMERCSSMQGEDIVTGAIREVKEETGVWLSTDCFVSNPQFIISNTSWWEKSLEIKLELWNWMNVISGKGGICCMTCTQKNWWQFCTNELVGCLVGEDRLTLSSWSVWDSGIYNPLSNVCRVVLISLVFINNHVVPLCRQGHGGLFAKSDLFFVCVLRPLSTQIVKQDSEIEAAQVLTIITYWPHVFVLNLMRLYYSLYMQVFASKVDMPKSNIAIM